MFTPIVLALCGAAAVAAIPHPFADFVSEGKVMVATEEGKTQLIDLNIYLESLAANNISLEAPEIDENWLNFTIDANVDINVDVDIDVLTIDKRQSCADTTVITTDTTQTFVDWDVQMSNVACAGANPMDIMVANGFSVSNSVSISGGLDAKPIKDRLSSSFGVDFSRSWTTSTLITNKGTVSPWNCGAMITKPLTTRRYGKIWKGCIGSLRQIGTFMADDRGTGSYNGVQWISGAVGWCEKRQNNPPLSRCSGSGNFR